MKAEEARKLSLEKCEKYKDYHIEQIETLIGKAADIGKMSIVYKIDKSIYKNIMIKEYFEKLGYKVHSRDYIGNDIDVVISWE